MKRDWGISVLLRSMRTHIHVLILLRRGMTEGRESCRRNLRRSCDDNEESKPIPTAVPNGQMAPPGIVYVSNGREWMLPSLEIHVLPQALLLLARGM